MKKISNEMSFWDCTFYKEHKFLIGCSVPIFNVYSYNGLKLIIGYAKYINPNNKILYRGECKIYSSMRPSINHTITSQRTRDKANSKINRIIEIALNDEKVCKICKSIIKRLFLLSEELLAEALHISPLNHAAIN